MDSIYVKVYSIYYADENYVANRATSTPSSIDSTSNTT
jgi:hypothetical protein